MQMIAGFLVVALLGTVHCIGFLSSNTDPDQLVDDFNLKTESLTITCFTNGIVPKSLGIVKIDPCGELETLARWDDSNGLDASLTDHPFEVDATPPTQINVTIADPGPEYATTYFCKGTSANQIVRHYHFKVKKAKVPVGEIFDRVDQNTDDIANLTDIINAMPPYEPQLDFSDEIEGLKNELHELEVTLNDTIDKCIALEEEVDLLQCDLNNTNFYVDSLDDVLLETSKPNNGRTYILSEFLSGSFLSAKAFCKARGGYLAEVDDASELNFVSTFLYNTAGYTQLVLVGGERTGDSGPFTGGVGGNTIQTDFFAGGDGPGNCLAFAVNFNEPGAKMTSTDCNFLFWNPDYGYVSAFLCEVPVGAVALCEA